MDTHATPLYNLWQKQHRLRLQLVGVCFITVCLVLWLLPNTVRKNAPTQTAQPTTQAGSGTLEKGTPDYKTLVPSGRNIESLGGWTRVSPPDHNPVYAYVDNISGIPITVSEQPLPDSFKSNTDSAVESLAKDYSANRYISTGSVTVYIGTSAKGPQSIIFVKNSTLILIKSTSALNDAQWTSYIQSLQ